MRPISVLLADDHSLVRDMLAARVEAESDLTVVAAVSNGQEAVEKAAEHGPEVVLLDIDMPGLSAFKAARRIKESSPQTRVIFLSAFFHDHYIEQALEIEASGYITKSEPPESVMRGIRTVTAGAVYFSPEVQARLVVGPSGVRLGQVPRTRANLLTARELEILRYLARGMAKKEIARTTGISVKTVEQHTTHLMDKLDIHDRVELARFAIREGLAEP